MYSPLPPGDSLPPDTALSEADYAYLLTHLEGRLKHEMRAFFRQRTLYLVLQGFSLLIFSVVLFLNAQRYHSPVIWAIGVCLLLFSLIEFLELDSQTSGKGVLDKLLPSSGIPVLEQEEDHAR
ncbi:MAG: hypothetical protein IV090_05370 [Candidatus Sericytochromatia bacterium]|nr:hypothetical protein [Candidatus Sericytochromatia bacterium]